jgi:hypothetical protein
MFQGPQLIVDLPTLNLAQLPKIALLTLIILYAIFSFMIYIKVRSLEKIVIFPAKSKIKSVPALTFFYFLLVVSLFLLAIAIV